MMFDSSRIDLVSLGLGFVAWLLAIGYVVFHRPERRDDDLSARYLEWKSMHGMPGAPVEEFLRTEGAGRTPLTRLEKVIVVTLLAVLALYVAFGRWGVIE